MEKMPEIASFVFFDIETTGLPWQERNQTKIIEFSFVAALRKDIMSTAYGETPLVSKLTFLLNPEIFINPVVTSMNNLSNDMLENEATFQEKLQNILSFLVTLPKPICLVAHNGNTFDFKILLAELNDINASLPNDLLCVDSLVGFRRILKGTNINYSNLRPPTPSNIDDLLTDDEDDDWPDFNVSQEQWKDIDEMCLSESLSEMSTEDLSEAEKMEKVKNIKTKRSEAIKKVFNKKSVAVTTEKESFTLTALYKRLLNKEEINAHRAEIDCLMLAQCVVALKDPFLIWADENCKLLTEIVPLSRIYMSRSQPGPRKPRQPVRAKPAQLPKPATQSIWRRDKQENLSRQNSRKKNCFIIVL